MAWQTELFTSGNNAVPIVPRVDCVSAFGDNEERWLRDFGWVKIAQGKSGCLWAQGSCIIHANKYPAPLWDSTTLLLPDIEWTPISPLPQDGLFTRSRGVLEIGDVWDGLLGGPNLFLTHESILKCGSIYQEFSHKPGTWVDNKWQDIVVDPYWFHSCVKMQEGLHDERVFFLETPDTVSTAIQLLLLNYKMKSCVSTNSVTQLPPRTKTAVQQIGASVSGTKGAGCVWTYWPCVFTNNNNSAYSIVTCETWGVFKHWHQIINSIIQGNQ
jgi:hypothetical protein